jgi:aryl-alcohol dehydrogenase-like predicted oxidoreductase
MQYRQLGRTNLQVSAIGLGAWQFAGDWAWGPQAEADSISAVQAALDCGITYFDTAEGYGDGKSEAILGKALQGRRDQAVIASKVSPNHLREGEMIAACERSLRNLGVETIDLYQIHWPNWQVPLEETVGALQRLQASGKIGAVGVSNFGPQDLRAFLNIAGECASDQLPYNLLWRSIEFELQPLCVQNHTSILCYSALAQGLLTGKFASAAEVPDGRARTRHYTTARSLARHGEAGHEAETFTALQRIRSLAEALSLPMGELALAWLLHQPGVACAIAGGRSPAQVRANAAAGGRRLDGETLRLLDEITRPLRDLLGANIDPYQAQSRLR